MKVRISKGKAEILKIYLAGPMRGYKYYNFPRFMQEAELLRAEGWAVINPAEIEIGRGFDPQELPENYDWNSLDAADTLTKIVKRDIEELCSCHAIAMIPRWEKSSGARAEWAVAQWLGLENVYLPDRFLPNLPKSPSFN